MRCWINTPHICKKVNVWAGPLNYTIIGPFVIEGDLNVEEYEAMLLENIAPRIRQVVNDSFAEICY